MVPQSRFRSARAGGDVEGYEGSRRWKGRSDARDDIFCRYRNLDVITIEPMRKITTAPVCNIGHFDSELQVAALQNLSVIKSRRRFDENRIGRWARHSAPVVGAGWMGCESRKCMGLLPSFVLVIVVHQQTLAQDRALEQRVKYKKASLYAAPRSRKEKLRLHWENRPVSSRRMMRARNSQPTFGCSQDGRIKPDHLPVDEGGLRLKGLIAENAQITSALAKS